MVYTGTREIKLKWKELDLVCKGLEVLIEQEKTLDAHHDLRVRKDGLESIKKIEDIADFLYFVLYDRPISNAEIDNDDCFSMSTGNEGDGVDRNTALDGWDE